MSNIKAGDLVMVVRGTPCCNSCNSVGQVFTVAEIEKDIGMCELCGTVHEATWYLDNSDGLWAQDCRLIKIDPPALPEYLEREKELSV